jgi:hypothetical protein
VNLMYINGVLPYMMAGESYVHQWGTAIYDGR